MTTDPETGLITKESLAAEAPLQLGPTARVRPAREAALDDAFASFAVVMRKLKEEINTEGADLDPKVVMMLVKSTDTFSKLVRTDILHDQHTSPEEIDEEELKALLPEIQKALNAGDLEIE